MAGYDSYFIYGKQLVDWNTTCAALVTKIYEFTSFNLRNQGSVARPNRFKRNASPSENIPGFRDAMGDISFNLHADDLVAFFLYLLNDAAISSTDFTAREVYGNGAGAGKAFGVSPLSLDTQPGATTPSSAPGKLIATLGAADSGTITITGTDQNDVAISEVLTFTAETGPKTTTKYFKTVNASGIVYAGITVGVALTLLITCDKNTYTHVITIGDALLDGLSIEAVKSGIPYTYIGALINSGTITIGDVLTMTMNFMAKRGWPAYKMALGATSPTASETPTDVSGYTSVSDKFYPAWGIALKLDGAATPTDVNGVTFTFNNGLIYPDRYHGTRDRRKPRRGANRDISIAVGVELTAADNYFDDMFEHGDDIPAVIECYCLPAEGPELSLTITAPRCQIGASPDPGVSEYSQVMQDIMLMPIRTAGAVTPDELSITLVCTAAS